MTKNAVAMLCAWLLAVGSVHAATVADFVKACQSSSNLEPAICTCAGEKAKGSLSPKGFDFLVASLQEDEAKTAKLRAELPLPEMIAASMFMAKGPAQCTQELSGQKNRGQ